MLVYSVDYAANQNKTPLRALVKEYFGTGFSLEGVSCEVKHPPIDKSWKADSAAPSASFY